MSSGTHEMALYIAGRLAGHVRQDENGALSFSYAPDYLGAPVSLFMPLSPMTYRQHVVRPYLMGLLPDDPTVRADIADRYGCSGENPFALLSHIGLDCPGAVQIVPESERALIDNRVGHLIELSAKEMEDTIRAMRLRSSSPWQTSNGQSERWSLGGAQSKIALRLTRGTWYRCEGDAATTHILKPGVSGYKNQALDEHLCLRLAASIGLPAAHTSFVSFGAESAVVIERYDRVTGDDGSVTRIHQEDLCQALCVDPSRKYAEQGGPSTPDVLALLAKTGRHAPANLRTFTLFLIFNYLVGATDAHAKNYSLLLGTRGLARLAPLYDVASIAPYQTLAPRRRKPLRAAMSIGGENRFGRLGQEHLRKLAADPALANSGVGYDWLMASARRMAEMVPGALREVVHESAKDGLAGIEAVGPLLEREVSANCRRLLERL